MYTTLIEPVELAAHLEDPDWVVVDCRFELSRPDWGLQAFSAGHIPNAVYAHLERDLSGQVTRDTGRHPLPGAGEFARKASDWGIGATVQVVAYDQGNGVYAARLWWMLRWIGHVTTAVLNGGFAAWQQGGFPIVTHVSARHPRDLIPQPGALPMTTSELQALQRAGRLERGEPVLVDARSAARFAGRDETIDPVAGHVPGARNHPFSHDLDEHGRFLPAEQLRANWLRTLRGAPPGNLVAMCGSGVTACHNLLALEVAGLHGGRLYAGSWSEWIRDAARPVETRVT